MKNKTEIHRKKIKQIENASIIDQKLMTSRNDYLKFYYLIKRQFCKYHFIGPPKWKMYLRMISTKKRMVPDFFMLGAIRSGTTLLSDYILQHPCIVLPLSKEPFINNFSKKYIYANFPSEKEKTKIQNMFGIAKSGFFTPVVPSMIFPFIAHQIAPKAKIIFLLRNPIDRTFAHWRWEHQLINTKFKSNSLTKCLPNFKEYVNIELEAIKSNTGTGFGFVGGRTGGYIQNSIYLPFIKLINQFYKKEDIMYVNFKDYCNDTIHTVTNIYKFLGLPKYKPVKLNVKNAGIKKTIDYETQHKLNNFFKPLNKQLFKYIGYDMDW